ncbi:transporter substrate-binding domain-containing protein [Leucothrix sargassi]|nr:transporter substrate-binding domain-containing protein [Leucothrix sargassi]
MLHILKCAKFSLVTLSFFLLVSGQLHAANDDTVVVVGGDYNYPPYEFIDADGQPSGYNVELTRAIAEVMGMQVEFHFGSWASVRQDLLDGKVDALQGMVSSEERKKTFDFSPPHAIVHQSIFARKDNASAISLDDLKGKQVAVQENGIMHDYLIQSNVGAELVTVETHADALRHLAAGKHDYALVANLPGLYLGKELQLNNIVPVGKPFQALQYGYAVRKGDDALLAQFSEGLAILNNTGRHQEIYNKWLGSLQASDISWRQYGKVAAIFSGLLLLILGGTMFWNRMLRLQVNKRTAELHLQQKQLIQADRMTSLGVLVSGVAHEINNPTGLLLLNLPMIQDVWADTEEILDQYYEEQGDFMVGGLPYSQMRNEIPVLLEDMNHGAGKIKRIVNDLKDFSRQEGDNLNQVFDLDDVVSTAVRMTEKSIKNSTDNFLVDYNNALPPVKGNKQRIEQVIINLILNACQSLQSRRAALNIYTFYDPKAKQVCLKVVDEGCGIEMKNLSRLFDPFFTTRREQGGTGLGLSISAGIVQSHGGELKFDSKLGEGTAVLLTLPVMENPND